MPYSDKFHYSRDTLIFYELCLTYSIKLCLGLAYYWLFLYLSENVYQGVGRHKSRLFHTSISLSNVQSVMNG